MLQRTKAMRRLMTLFIALVAGVVLSGCHGGIGWDRMPGSIEHHNQTVHADS